jgi:transposase
MPVTVPLPNDLPTDLTQCHQLIQEMARDIVQYQSRIDYLARRLFGRRSEKIDASELTFFGQEDFPGSELDASPEEIEPESVHAPAPSKRRNGRRPLPRELPRKRIEHDVAPEDKICAGCGGMKKRIGEETSEQLEYIPASLYVIEHVRPKYACPCCQAHVAIGVKPAQPIEKGLPGPGLIAHVITSKYCDHVPLHRQERIFTRHGVDLSRKTLCDWALQSAWLLEPIVNLMKNEVLGSFAIHTDDTPVPVQSKGRTHRAYLWVYVGDSEHPFTIYDFTWTRSREGPEQILKEYHGYLQADAYSGYDQLYADGNIVEVACWAHARRKFFEAKTSAPVAAHQALLAIKQLYAVEREAKDLDAEARLALRREKSQPRLEAFAVWLRQLQPEVLPKSPLGQAAAYALGNWEALTRYLEDGRLAIDNNTAERALRGVVLGRKNYLFTGSERGGRAAAVHYSLIQSAKQNGLDPFVYLRDLLARIPTHPYSQIRQLLPNHWKTLSVQD